MPNVKSGPDFSWPDASRGSGVFCHLTSLPNRRGIGGFGREAESFMDFLKSAGFKYWQICPVNPTGFGDSPYQSFSAFALNPYFADLDELVSLGLLDEADLSAARTLPEDRCNFGAIYEAIPRILNIAADRLLDIGLSDVVGEFYSDKYSDFLKREAFWLDSYAAFCALKKRFCGASWTAWPDEFKRHFAFIKIESSLGEEYARECARVKIVQWILSCQCAKFKRAAADRELEIIGDMPIFLSADSADLWEHPELFDIDDRTLLPRNVAGVGPDFFSADGQLWGNPLYDWKGAKKGVFDFWALRLKKAFEYADVIRLDHFRGFADYWAIPAKTADAKLGKWKIGPGVEFFEFLRRKFPTQKFLAEDLGIMSDRVYALMDAIKIPSMLVLQFAFGGDATNPYLPHNHKREAVCYTGTHDNDTTLSWYATASENVKDHYRRYFRTDGSGANWTLICSALASVAQIAIIPLQDILDLGGNARFNTPGKAAGNWQWRFTVYQEKMLQEKVSYLRQINVLFGRIK